MAKLSRPQWERHDDMLIQSEAFHRRLEKPVDWDEHVFRFCTFSGFDAEGDHIDSSFIDCAFEGCDFYWAMFNVVTLAGVTFKNCRFRGCAFSGCRIADCSFENCDFTGDAFDKGCSFDGSRWHACTQRGTSGLAEEWVAIADARDG
jgi:uncharacterized protein YjbI with pentapeptide repeats